MLHPWNIWLHLGHLWIFNDIVGQMLMVDTPYVKHVGKTNPNDVECLNMRWITVLKYVQCLNTIRSYEMFMLVHVHPYVPCSKSSLFTVNITMFIHVHGQKPSSFPFSMLKNATFRHKRKHHCHPLQGKKTPSSPCSMFKITTFHRRITVVILPKTILIFHT